MIARTVFALAVVLFEESICLRMVDVIVPAYRVRGETALLECQYELEKDTLYSVKWYKDNEEFYRFVPKFTPPHHSYRIDGIKVDHHHSDDKKVTLKGVTLKSSGLFRCEVSAEAPSFASGHRESRMLVVFNDDTLLNAPVPVRSPELSNIGRDLPKDGPHISGQEKDYQIGDTLSLNCTSGRSYPAAQLQWYVNDEKVTNSRELVDYVPVNHQHGLVTAILGLRLQLMGRHFPGGALRARCIARVSPVLWAADSESRLERVEPLVDNREALLLVKSGTTRSIHRRFEMWAVVMVFVNLYYFGT